MTLMDNISVIHSDMKPDDRQLMKWLPDACMTAYMRLVISIFEPVFVCKITCVVSKCEIVFEIILCMYIS